MKKIFRLIAYTLFIFLVAGYWLFPPPNQNINIKFGHEWENYDPSLFYKLQSIGDFVAYADDSLGKENRHTLDYVRLLSRTVSYRFFHGYSSYSFRHNWISYLAGNLVWDDLDAVVIPNDILKFPNAACSQVSIVLADALKKIGVPYRKVGLKGHFALEANLNGKWYYFDPNLEPHFPKGRKSLEELIKNNELYTGYEGHITKEKFRDVFSEIQYSKPNVALAPNATLFHKTTFPLSILIAIALLIFVVIDLGKALLKKSKGQDTKKAEMSQFIPDRKKSYSSLNQ
ncbi:hypothetical protein [Flavisolibacter tropicus]|nr:hypothetical protein [Flavisolibacter tropicus]